MKRILILSFIYTIISIMPICAQNEDISVNCVYDSVQNCFAISGTLQAEKSGDFIVLYVYLDNVLMDVSHTYSVYNRGKITYSFPPVYFNTIRKSGTVSFQVHASHIIYTGVYECQYYGADKYFTALKFIEPTLFQDEFETFLDNVKTYKAELGVNIDKALLLSDFAKTKMQQIIRKIQLDLPLNIDTPENIEKAFSAVQKFRTNFRVALMAGCFYEMSNSEDFKQWYDEYKNIILINTYDEKAGSYLEDVQKSDNFNLICKNTSGSLLTLEDIQKRLTECVILSKISLTNASFLKGIFDYYPENFVSDYTERLTDMQKESVLTKLAGSLFYKYSDLMVKYDQYAAELLDKENKTEHSNGAREDKGGNWGSSSGAMINLPTVNTNDEKTVQQDICTIFKDIKDVPWAQEAVGHLFSQNIISGKSDGIFAPNDNITRAEFIKLVVCAAGFSIAYDNIEGFNDISDEEWYYPYIMTARKRGITQGTGSNEFHPNDNITRQDMMVILYRVFKADGKSGGILDFTDSDEINDYAKEAVSYWYSVRVINGMGDGSFGAMYMATRAQAAQVLYKVISLN